MSSNEAKSGATENTSAVAKGFSVFSNAFVADTKKVASAEKTASNRWVDWKEHADRIDLRPEYTKSPNGKDAKAAGKGKDDELMMRGEDGKQILVTYGEVYQDCLRIAALFLPAEQQKLLKTKKVKGEDPAVTKARGRASNDRSSILTKFREKLAGDKPAGDKGANRTRSPEVRIVECLNNAIKLAQMLEEPTWDVTKFVAQVKPGIAMVTMPTE